MRPEQKKYLLIGGLAVAGAAAVYFLTRSKRQSQSVADFQNLDSDSQQLHAKIIALGEPKFSSDRKLDFQYLLKFIEVIAVHAKIMQMRNKRRLKEKRMEALKNKDDQKYSQVVLELIEQEDEITNLALETGSSFIGLSQEEVEDQIAEHSQDNMKGYQIMNLQQDIATRKIEDPSET
jgi:hypothetical protein